MKVFKHTNQSKKLILVIVCIMLFSFCCPKPVHAMLGMDDIVATPCIIGFAVEKGLIKLLNNMFCDDNHKYEYSGSNTKIYLTPESIIKGKFSLLDANIFKPINEVKNNTTNPEDDDYYDVSGGSISDSLVTGRNSLREIISGWYYALRNLAIVALLSVLVYVGIRMLMTSVSQDKAKYKTMLKDWLIALALLFAMHYIMVGILNISSEITNAIGRSGKNADLSSKSFTILTHVTEEGGKVDEGTSGTTTTKKVDGVEFKDYSWDDSAGSGEKYTIWDGYAHMIMLGAILAYTVIFAIKYLKRMITIIFLILLAPISCITYPIDKIADGKAQAYNMWFQEFLYNVIIQPFHLLIYIVLVGSATALADKNLLYGIMCFAVMIPAEKFIKQMFGFKDKLGSPLGAFASGALFSKLAGKGSGGSSGSQNSGSSEKGSELPPPTKDTPLPGAEEKNAGGNDNGTNLETDDSAGQELGDETNSETDSGADQGIGDGSNPEIDGEEEREIGDGRNPETDDDTEQETGDETNSEGNNDTDPEEGNNTEQNAQTEKKEPGRWKRAGRAATSKIGRHYIKKYGTKKLGVKDAISSIKNKDIKGAASALNKGIVGRATKKGAYKAYSTSKKLGKRAIKGATSLAGAGVGYLAGAMFGQGKAGAAAGAALGSRLGKGITNVTDKAWGSAEGMVSDMHNAFWDKNEENDKRKFKQNENNVKLARQNYRDRHGEEGKSKDIENELDRMYEMQSHGIEQKNFNDTIRDFETYTDPDGNYKMNDTEAMNTAMSSALQAQNYSAKDFKDEKTMKQAYENLAEQYKAAGVPQDKADEKIRQILNGGARMRGVKNPPLPPVKQKVTIPTANNMYGKLKFTNDANGQAEQEQVQAIQDVLVEIGFDDNKIKQVMEYSSGNTNEEIITSFAQNVKYIVSNDIKENNNIEVEEIKSGRFKQHIVKNETVIKENVEKLDLSKKTGVTDKSQLEKMRALEIKEGTTKFREEGGKMIRGEYSKNDKNNLSEKALEMAEGYKRATTTKNPNTKKKKK